MLDLKKLKARGDNDKALAKIKAKAVMEHFGGGTIVYYIIAQPPQVLSLYSHLYTCVAYFLAIELGHMHLRY